MEYLVLTKTDSMILGPVAEILGLIMDGLFHITSAIGIVNIGLCIILFTLVVKLLMLPLTIKQQKSSKLTAIMQPEIKAIQEKYKGKKDNDSVMRMNVETKAVYEKYGTSMTGGCVQLLIQMPILFALYRVVYNIPAYVSSVKDYFMQVVYAITGVSDASSLSEGAADSLLQFATDQNVTLTGMVNIGDLTGISGVDLGNKMVDILYKLKPSQWDALGDAFPEAAAIIATNAEAIEGMNSFLGINLSNNPWQGMVPSIAWLIPILAGLSQWYSTKLMSSQQKKDPDAPGAQMMQQMNVTMPLMSMFFCFTFPAAVGLYWVASSVFQIVQQMGVNAYLSKVDMDEMIRKNVEKSNKKREKKGLPPQTINQKASVSLKNMELAAQNEEKVRSEKIEQSREIEKESTEYYNKDAKPGSLAAKANMVAKYNEKNSK